MFHSSEQRDEIEALSEIYYKEIQVLSDKTPISFSITIRPQASDLFQESNSDEENSDDDESDDGESLALGPSVKLLFELPETYPDVKPKVKVLEYSGLEESDICNMLSIIDNKAVESLGTVMVFMLVSEVTEWLISKNDKVTEEIEQAELDRQKILEAEEKKRFEGTPVTEQTFLAWKAKFDAELLKARIDEQKKMSEQQSQGQAKRLTGREMFETDKTLAESDLNFVEDLDQSQIEALLMNIDEITLGDDIEDESFELEDESEESENDD